MEHSLDTPAGYSSKRRATTSQLRKESSMRLAVVLVASVAALAVATTAVAAVITRHAKTASYSLTLVVGAMMAGSMSAMKGQTERHLELQVRTRASGAVVTNVIPQISVTDATAKSMGEKLSVSVMEG